MQRLRGECAWDVRLERFACDIPARNLEAYRDVLRQGRLTYSKRSIPGAAMSPTDNEQKITAPRVTSRLHPRVYALLVGLAVWLVLSVWIFAGAGVTDYLLSIVSGFVFIAVALPCILSRVGRIEPIATSDSDRLPLRDWLKSDFDTWQGRISGVQAAVQILLPICAVAFGMTAFGIALHIAERGTV